MQTANDIRKAFIDFFAKRGHQVVDSSPLVPSNDPTLLFTNAGMVQFKNLFTGLESRDYVRAASSQKCLRAGGKHNDLENVGYTARHHTFFEMLGNFSFGDYFKEEAILYAWEMIVKEFGLSKDRLWVTVYAEDDEAHDLWQKISGLPEERILRIPTSDNFWAMGPTGPCGPCSEIFYDHGDHIFGGPPGTPDEDGDRFVELWNLVFMQYDQVSADERVSLPKPSIDTGMGLERITAALQGTHDNYRIDLFRSLIEASAEITKTDPDGEQASSHRVIADHLRAASFMIGDGILPSNEGRGYVLRRIMRRAMRHAKLLGCEDPLLHLLTPSLVSEMGQAFPELSRAEALISETLLLEETRFRQTLDRGLKLLDEATTGLGEGGVLSGEVAFKLYDTYGFPVDLTRDAMRARGMGVDEDGFNAAMEHQRTEARKAWSGSGDAATDEIWFAVRDAVGASEFLGYETKSAKGVVAAIVSEASQVEKASAGDAVFIVVNQTPFYGQSGGQEGDTGVISWGKDGRAVITEAQKKVGDLVIHPGKIEKGSLSVGDEVSLAVDQDRRLALRSNHSATHLLHASLRERLGDHVTQKGSLVASDRLRFDISHQKPVTAEELAAVEQDVNAEVRGNTPVNTLLMDPEQAVEKGAMALFGEKYGEEVRVVSMGGAGDEPYSVELCGGTHVSNTGEIGMFKVVSEGAVSAGVRRIEAITGEAAQAYIGEREKILRDAASLLKTKASDVPDRIKGLLEERKTLERELAETRRKLAAGGPAGPEVSEVGGVKYALRLLDGVPAKDLKAMADEIKDTLGSGVVGLVALNDGKVSLVVGVTGDLVEKVNAVDLVRAGAAAVGGKGGGGRPDMAQAGGPDAARAKDAIASIEEALRESL
jgi:alanyl-tRNA synthetase